MASLISTLELSIQKLGNGAGWEEKEGPVVATPRGFPSRNLSLRDVQGLHPDISRNLVRIT
jgi:hypothetical protein